MCFYRFRRQFVRLRYIRFAVSCQYSAKNTLQRKIGKSEAKDSRSCVLPRTSAEHRFNLGVCALKPSDFYEGTLPSFDRIIQVYR